MATYTPPTPIGGVEFTDQLTADNYNNGTYVLAEWARKNPTAQLGLQLSYQGLIDQMEQYYPTYIEYLGTLVGQYGTDPMIQVADQVAGNGKFTYPIPADFSSAISSIIGAAPSTISVLGNGIADAASAVESDVTSAVKGIAIGGSVLIIIVLVFAGVLIYQGKVKIPVPI